MEASIEKSSLASENAALVRAAHFGKESQYLRLRRVRTSLNEFTILARLGKGGYGQVYLCRKVDTGEILALKQMKKSRFTDKNEVHRVKKEREVMTKTNSIWLARLKYCFQSQHYLYMAMEYIPGGDLKTLLDHMTVLEEADARFLFAEMLLAVDALHQLGYIHRDLKPDNFMIDRNGHLKLIDFGLSKEAVSEKLNTSRSMKRRQSSFRVGTWSKNNTTLTLQAPRSRNKHRKVFSVVGSPEYMALEILNQEGYSNLVDYWSLGVILFEFMFGYTPFGADTVAGVFENVQNHKNRVVRPPRDEDDEDSEEVSEECWDLITKLITPASQRIGKTGIDEVKRHPWFADFDWDAIREMEPPFIPNLESENDTSYFPTEEPIAQAGLEELEADLDHLISKQLARSSEGSSMEAVFDHRSKKTGERSILSPVSSKGESPLASLTTNSKGAIAEVPPSSASPTLVPLPAAAVASSSPTERDKSSSKHSSRGRRGSSKRDSPIITSPSTSHLDTSSTSATPHPSSTASNSVSSANISSTQTAAASNTKATTPPPPLSAATEHPKLKFNQSYSKFDFAGFTFKHEDFALLESGSPREMTSDTRERSGSTVDLDSLAVSSFLSSMAPMGSSLHSHASLGAGQDQGEAPNTVRQKGSSPGHSPGSDGLLPGSSLSSTLPSSYANANVNVTANGSTSASTATTTTIMGHHLLTLSEPPGSALPPHMSHPTLMHSSSTNSSTSSSSTSSSSSKRAHTHVNSSSVGGHESKSSKTASPLKSGKSKNGSGSSASSTGANNSPHSSNSPHMPHSPPTHEQYSHSLEESSLATTSEQQLAARLSRTNTVQVLHVESSPSIHVPRPSFDGLRHADSTPTSIMPRGSKGDDIDSLKRRLTRLKKPSDMLGDGGGTSSNDDMPPPLTSLHSSDSSFGNGRNGGGGVSGGGTYSDSESRFDDLVDLSTSSPGGTAKKKRKEGTLKKIQGLFEKLSFVSGSSSKTTSTADSPASNSSSSSHHSGSSPHIVVSSKGQSMKSALPSPRERTLSQPPLSATSATTSPVASTQTTSDFSPTSIDIVTRNRSGTTGYEEIQTHLSPELAASKASKHKSEGRQGRHAKPSSRSEISSPPPPPPPPASTTASSASSTSSYLAGSMNPDSPSASMITSPGGKKKKRSSSRRSSITSDVAARHGSNDALSLLDPPPSSSSSSSIATSDVTLATDQQLRKERLLALARAFQESQASSSKEQSGSSPPSAPLGGTGTQSAVSSGRSSPRMPSPFRSRDDGSLEDSSLSRSRRSSETRRHRGSSGTPTRKPISSRLSSIDPLEEASNEATPEKASSSTPPLSSDKERDKDGESKMPKDKKEEKSRKAKHSTRRVSLDQDSSPPVTSPTTKSKDKTSLKDSKSSKSTKP